MQIFSQCVFFRSYNNFSAVTANYDYGMTVACTAVILMTVACTAVILMTVACTAVILMTVACTAVILMTVACTAVILLYMKYCDSNMRVAKLQ